jgi:hypothetical protein
VIPYQRLSSGPIDSPLREQKPLGAALVGKPKNGRASPSLFRFLPAPSNDVLNEAALRWGQLVEAGALDEEEIDVALLELARR